MNASNNQPSMPRLGLHYFPDTLHYRTADLETWLPEFQKMGIGWLTLLAPDERAIPESFIQGLIDSGIQPVLHFPFSTQIRTSIQTMRLLFRSYARWGVAAAALFDRPNLRSNWKPSDWAQSDLVERFLDLFIPLADAAAEEGLAPIFPPLEPGGDYWDLSFLQSALQGISRRCRPFVLSKLGLGAYAWQGQRSLEWGMGGPDRWPDVKPYITPPESEDHRGFRVFDWYSAVAQNELDQRLPIYLLRAGALPADCLASDGLHSDLNAHAQRNLSIAEMFVPGSAPEELELSIPSEIVCCNFWLLSAEEYSPYLEQAWFGAEAEPLPVVNGFYRLAARNQILMTNQETNTPPILKSELPSINLQATPQIDAEEPCPTAAKPLIESEPIEMAGEPHALQHASQKTTLSVDSAEPEPPISHYVLLPLYAWGAADWDLSIVQPMIQESHPTIGFSLTEARLAQRVTVVGGEGAISNDALNMLRSSGCYVERILDDGTLVAS